MDIFNFVVGMFAPLGGMLSKVMATIPTLLSALIVLVVGIVFSNFVHRILSQLFKEIYLDSLVDKTGLSSLFQLGGTKYKVSDLLSSCIYLVLVVMFMIMTLEILGIVVMGHLINKLVGYVPTVIHASIILAIGVLLAKVMGVIIQIIAENIHLPEPKLLEKVTYWSILIYAFKVSLSELGYDFLFSGVIFHTWFAGLVLGLALAFGLGGRDIAAKYLEKKK